MSLRRSATRRDGAPPVRHRKEYSDLLSGLKQLHPKDNTTDTDIDIVLVPGLGADPETSFASSTTKWDWTTSDEGGLIRDFPKARVLLFTYASAWTGSLKVKQFMPAVATSLLTALDSVRDPSKSQRPIVFIGHSMGGLVIAKAVALAETRKDRFKNMFESIAAAVFFGTPFAGAFNAQAAVMFAYFLEKVDMAERSKLLELMTPGNESLRELVNDLTRQRRMGPEIDIFCFYEECETDWPNIGPLPILGKLGIKPPKKVGEFVTRDSATLRGCDEQGLLCAHRELVKFDGYKDARWDQYVRTNLKRIVPRAYASVKKRLNAVSGVNHDDITGINKALDPPSVEKKRKALRQTFSPSTWITKEAEYLDWLTMPREVDTSSASGMSCLWIRGPQGRGKTSATMAVLEGLEALIERTDTKNAETDRVNLIYFFCDPASDYCTPEDLMKSLISQLIDVQWMLTSHAKQFIVKKKGTEDKKEDKREATKPHAQLTIENLWQAFSDMLADQHLDQPLFIVISNLHHLYSASEDSTKKLLSYINAELTSGRNGTSSSGKSRWLLTSRKIDEIDGALEIDGVRLVDLEDQKYEKEVHIALRRHAKTKIEDLSKDKEYNRALAYFASSLLGKRALNTQWIDIVASQLKELPKVANNQDLKVRHLLETLPQDLKALLNLAWLQIFKSNEEDADKMKEMLRTLVLTFEDPTVSELGVIAGFSAEDKDKVELCHLVDCCKPLLFLKGSANKQVVCFMNTVVKSHLLDNAEQLLSLSKDEVEWQHGVIALRSFTHLKQVFEDPKLEAQLKEADEEAARKEAEEEERANNVEEDDAESDNDDDDSDDDDASADGEGDDDADADSDDDDSDIDSDESEEAKESDLETRFFQGKALAYTVKHWLHHASKATREIAEDISLEDDFWRQESTTRRRWIYQYAQLTDLDDFNFQTFSGLHVAASLGFSELVSALIRNGHKDEIVLHDDLANTPLHLAAFYGRPTIVDVLLGFDAPVDDGIEGGQDTPLHMAAQQAHVKVMKKLLSRKVNPANADAVSESSGPAINAAISSGNNIAVGLLVDHGINLSPDLEGHQPPLALAASISDAVMFGELVEKFEGKLKPEDYSKALASAAAAGKGEIFQRLLQFPHEQHWLQQALDDATYADSWSILSILIENKPDLDYEATFLSVVIYGQGKDDLLASIWKATKGTISAETLATSLYRAVDNERLSTVQLLLQDCKADPNWNHEDEMYGSALTASANDGTMEILELLLQAGADAKDPHGYALQAAAVGGHLAIVERLLEAGADVNAVAESPHFTQGTAIQGAVEEGQNKFEMVSLLLEKYKADPNLFKGDYGPPLVSATGYGEQDIFELLMKATPRPEVNIYNEDNKSTPLTHAAQYLSEKAVGMLIDAGADLEATDKDGDTALMCAVIADNVDVVALLLEQGANMAHTNHEGRNALQVACEWGHKATTKILIAHASSMLRYMHERATAGDAGMLDVVQHASNVRYKRGVGDDDDYDVIFTGEDDANLSEHEGQESEPDESVTSPTEDVGDLASPTSTTQDDVTSPTSPVVVFHGTAHSIDAVQNGTATFENIMDATYKAPPADSPVSQLPPTPTEGIAQTAEISRISSWGPEPEIISHTPPRRFAHELPGDFVSRANAGDQDSSSHQVRRKPAPTPEHENQFSTVDDPPRPSLASDGLRQPSSMSYSQAQSGPSSNPSFHPEHTRYGSSGSPQPPFRGGNAVPGLQGQSPSPVSSTRIPPPTRGYQVPPSQGNSYAEPLQPQPQYQSPSPPFMSTASAPEAYQPYQGTQQQSTLTYQSYHSPPPPVPQAYRPAVAPQGYATPPFDPVAYQQRQTQRRQSQQQQQQPPLQQNYPQPTSNQPTYQAPPSDSNPTAYQQNVGTYQQPSTSYSSPPQSTPYSQPPSQQAPPPPQHPSQSHSQPPQKSSLPSWPPKNTPSPDYSGQSWGLPPATVINNPNAPSAPDPNAQGRLGPRRGSSFFTETGSGMKSAFKAMRKDIFSGGGPGTGPGAAGGSVGGSTISEAERVKSQRYA